MPDKSKLAIELLKRMGWPEPAPSRSVKALTPRPATLYPKVDRALAEVEKEYPGLRGIDVGAWPFESPLTGSTTLAHTISPAIQGLFEPHIQYNPRLEANKQDQIQGSLAHELRHVMQSDAGKRASGEYKLPYEKRPLEIDAYRFQDKYKEKHKIPLGTYPPEDRNLFNAIVDSHRGVIDLFNKTIGSKK